MDRTAFETELRAQGYGEVVDRRMEANALNPEHAHEFDARLLVLEGAMTIVSEGKDRVYRAGDTFEMSAGCRHSEQCGPEGARYGRHPVDPAAAGATGRAALAQQCIAEPVPTAEGPTRSHERMARIRHSRAPPRR